MLQQYIDYKYIPFIGTAIFAVIASLLFIYILTVKLKEKRLERDFDKQLQFSSNPEIEFREEESFISKQMKALPSIMIKAEIVGPEMTLENLQKKITMYFSIAFLIGALMFRNPLGGFIPVIFLYIGVYVFAMFKLSKKRNLINEQIPAFISTFKANIQANQHAQNAMINAIDNTASPLYDELARAKAIMEAGDFRPGIVSLRMNAENETLRQLASCIELASASGSNIEEQIEVIEEIIKDKQKIERKKKLGINENKPLFYIAAAFVPISFVGSYLLSDMHRTYWFTTPASYLILLGVVITMILSSYATWKVIQKVDIG